MYLLFRNNLSGKLLAMLIVFCLAASPIATALGSGSARQETTQPAAWSTLPAFFDETIGSHLSAQNVAGAAVTVVKDGQILFSQGYGEADLANFVSVSPDRTLFRIASVTKLFTWTAVMQLVEQGRLDLDADVNLYLDFEIPPAYAQPVTLRHLMSHSAGFEDRRQGIFVAAPDQLVPASQWLPANLPARVRPPGVAASYSNYGAALAGYIVERVSGMSYEEYLEAHIFQPLGMTRTSARQPLPPDLADDLAIGYAFIDGAFSTQPFDVLQTAPGGSISASATDMAAFMIAHLQNGRYGAGRILNEATAQQMHSVSFRHDPRLRAGYAYGFEQRERNGRTVLSHAGEFQYFSSRLDLLPEENLGVFVTYNGQVNARLLDQLFQDFLDRYYPFTPQPTAAPAPPVSPAASLTGLYQSNRHAYTTVEKMLLLVQPVYRLRIEGNLLVLSNPNRPEPQRFIEIEPLLFTQVDGPERLAFRQAENGTIEIAFLESRPDMALDKLGWYQNPVLHQALFGLVLLLFLSVPVVSVAGFVQRRLRLVEAGVQPRLARATRWTITATAGLSWLFLILTAVVTIRLMSSLGADSSAVGLLAVLVWMPRLIALLAMASLALIVIVWQKGYWQLPGRIYYTLAAAAALVFTWLLAYWNLLAIS